MDPVEIDDEAANMQFLSGGQNLGSLGRSTVVQPKRLRHTVEKDDPQPESAAEVGRTMTFTRWSAQRQQQGYPARRFKS
jgi:hypothetical protein